MNDALSSEFQEHVEFHELIEFIEGIGRIRDKYGVVKPSPEAECCKEEIGLILTMKYRKIINEISSDRKAFGEFIQADTATNNEIAMLVSQVVNFQSESMKVQTYTLEKTKEQSTANKRLQKQLILLQTLTGISVSLNLIFIILNYF